MAQNVSRRNKLLCRRKFLQGLGLTAAGAAIAACQPSTVVVEKEVEKVVTATPVPPTKPPIPYTEALAAVQARFPAELSMTNELLPTEADLENITPGPARKVRVGEAWIKNDEQAPEYNAIELGYYRQEGLEVEIFPSGEGPNSLQLVAAGGPRDIAVATWSRAVSMGNASRTPMDIMAVGCILKRTPFCYITAVPEMLEAAQRRRLTPYDVIGYNVGAGKAIDPHWVNMMLDMYDIPRDAVNLVTNDWNIRASFEAGCQWYPGWRMNQPRDLDEFAILDYGHYVCDEASQVYVVRQETLEDPEGRDWVRRFLRATYRGLLYLLKNPEHSAEIAVELAGEGSVTYDRAMERFRLQRPLIVGDDDLGLMHMHPGRWDRVVALHYQYGLIELPG